MLLRFIKSDDIDDLVALDRLCFSRGVAYTKDEFLYFLSLKNNLGALYEEKQRVFAFILAAWSKDVAEVITIDVHPAYRRKGFGTLMLHFIEEEFKKLKITRECLHVSTDNQPALGFYEKEGFEIIDTIRNYYRNEGHAYLMFKNLALPIKRGIESE